MFVVLKRLHFWVYLLLVTTGYSDCADEVTKKYGQAYSLRLSKNAYSLEFSPMNDPEVSLVLWDRTDPGVNQGGRGRMEGNHWIINNVTQHDQGHYTLRAHNKKLIKMYKLWVSEWEQYHSKMEGEDFVLEFHLNFNESTLTFTHDLDESKTMDLMRNGVLLSVNDEWSPHERSFQGRIWQQHRPSDPAVSLVFENLREYESGTFKLFDRNGNLALAVHLTVLTRAPLSYYIRIAVGIIFMVILCYCCVKKFCCKKSSSKRDNSVPETAAAPAVYYHDNTSHFSGPSYTCQPAYLQHPSGPAHPSHSPGITCSSQSPGLTHPSHSPGIACSSQSPGLTHPSHSPGIACSSQSPGLIHPSQPSGPTYSSQPASAVHDPLLPAAGEQGAAPSVSLGSDRLSSDPEPQFELKGLPFPSAPPLTSDTTHCDVYTSDKLNFL